MVDSLAGKIAFAQVDSILAAGFAEADVMTRSNIIPAQVSFEACVRSKSPTPATYTAIESPGL